LLINREKTNVLQTKKDNNILSAFQTRRKKSDAIEKNKNRQKQEEAFEKTIRIFQSLNEEKCSKEEINDFLKKELSYYLKFLSEIERKCKTKGFLSLLQKLNYKKERLVFQFIFVLEIMISNLRRIEKIQARRDS